MILIIKDDYMFEDVPICISFNGKSLNCKSELFIIRSS